MSLRVIFMGTPDFSVPTLMEIVGQGHDVVACYSQPPRPAGRGMDLKKSPVHEAAESFGIPVFTPQSLKGSEEQEAFAALNADVAVVVAYGLLLPKPILEAPEYGCLNLHASMLPRWRGAAPINRAIMAGDTETAVQVMRMEEGLDTGAVCMSETVAIGENMTAGDLHDKLSSLGGDLMVRALAALSRGALGDQTQAEEGVTYAAKLSKQETRIDWSKPAAEVHNHIRGLSPFPGAWCEMPLGGKMERVKVLRSTLGEGSGTPGSVHTGGDVPVISCGTGAVRLEQVQRAGKKPMSGAEFLRGASLSDGTVLD
ncbi:Methionyl-tRNA formyltransferase [Labrenzia sp. THAF191b]|uniref:methionyl-tRNA formyltransferase n=1 Tax=unclassified Labrenzia TaxID=2648686 RepID=UPI00126928A5|nr:MULTISPECIES: methionyl-tRNA formyltransferase [unclassified Labrenzia]QFS96199.1 Methionyl-tRNA formyltransferase [Labrenzia sp. THAF191b]QFT02514.1 Methionyl-tRNA formyltransferase [Labrenzia sp. THAF191a]QFT14056.1 Methionyl-tRNA formyltransferase [Labrenzia sp. THAF187b]